MCVFNLDWAVDEEMLTEPRRPISGRRRDFTPADAACLLSTSERPKSDADVIFLFARRLLSHSAPAAVLPSFLCSFFGCFFFFVDSTLVSTERFLERRWTKLLDVGCCWMLRSAFHRAAEWAWLRCRPEFSIGRKKEAKGLKAPRGVVEVFQCETKEVVVVVTRSGRCRGRRHRLRRRARRD